MIDLGPHAAYIWASFTVTFAILGFMVVASVAASRRASQRLAAIEAQEKNR